MTNNPSHRTIFDNRKETSLVSVVIPVYNRFDLLRNLLDSYFLNETEQDIIIVDDGSNEDIKKIVKEYKFTGAIIQNTSNSGFATSCNRGSREAKSKYLMFMNSDITITAKNWLINMIQTLENSPNAGVVSPVLLSPDKKILYSGSLLTDGDYADGSLDHKHFDFCKDNDFYTESFTGACFLGKTKILQKCFDEIYSKGYGFEDADLALNLSRRGLYNVVCAKTQLIHVGSASFGNKVHVSPEKEKNRIIFRDKWKNFDLGDHSRKVSKINRPKRLSCLLVSHGLPPENVAGVEVYTYHLAQEMSKREIDLTCLYPWIKDGYYTGQIFFDRKMDNTSVYKIVNADSQYDYFLNRTKGNLDLFKPHFIKFLKFIDPDVVHFQHTNFMSVDMVEWTKKYSSAKTVYTLNEYLPICGNHGQLVTTEMELCEGAEIKKCAGCLKKDTQEIEQRTLTYKKNLIEFSDILLAPSEFLMKKFIEWGVPSDKIKYSPYGFKTFSNHRRKASSYISKNVLTFAFFGKVSPYKGLEILLDAFGEEIENARLEIHGICHIDEITKKINKACEKHWIKYMGPYDPDAVPLMLDRIDVLVVPSIWWENAPLVIHEARILGIPVLGSDIGGTKELMKKLGGFTFRVANAGDLRNKIIHLCKNRELLYKISKQAAPIKTLEENVDELMKLYQCLAS